MTTSRRSPSKEPRRSTPPEHEVLVPSRVVPSVRCDGCGAEIDPLRAGHVAVVGSRMRYFCSFDACRPLFIERAGPSGERSSNAAVASADSVDRAGKDVRPFESAPPPPGRLDDGDELVEPLAPARLPAPRILAEPPPPRELTLLLVALTLVAGLLGLSLELAEPTSLVRLSRLILIALGATTIASHALTNRHSGAPTETTEDAAPPNPVATVGPPVLALIVAIAGTWATETQRDRTLLFASTIVTLIALTIGLTTIASRAVDQGRRWVHRVLEGDAEPHPSQGAVQGEPVTVAVGDTVPVDVAITEGEVEVEHWVEASPPQRRRAGQFLVAGSRVLSGTATGLCTAARGDRAIARALLAADHRPDVHSDTVLRPRRLVERGSLLAGLVAAAIHLALRGNPVEVAMVGVAVYAALASLSLLELPSLTIARGILMGLDRGVIYRTPKAWDLAGRVTAAVFCARGTLLRGEPELVEIERVSGHDSERGTEEILALAASCFAAEPTPIARALKRAARDRAVPVDRVRNTRTHEGRGVTGTALSGEPVCVGSRDLMLERRVSIAIAEETMARLEASGRTVLLVARNGRLLGVCALQDGLRPGARAAVQHLLDVRVEPVLMSSDTAATCEALGRALDVDHLRAEVPEDERGAAIQRIRDTGATVAVLGHAGVDDLAFRNGDVAVSLGDAGRANGEAGVATVLDDVRDAAVAIAIAQRWRRRTLSVFGLVLAPAVLGSMIVTAGLLAPEFAPLAQWLGTVAAVWQLTSEDRSE